MFQIRHGVFETNSSSTHSLTVCSKKEYQRWMMGELFLYQDDGKLYSREDAIAMLKLQKWYKNVNFDNQGEIDKIIENEFDTFESYGHGFDTFDATYKTESGDEVVAFGYAGFDG